MNLKSLSIRHLAAVTSAIVVLSLASACGGGGNQADAIGTKPLAQAPATAAPVAATTAPVEQPSVTAKLDIPPLPGLRPDDPDLANRLATCLTDPKIAYPGIQQAFDALPAQPVTDTSIYSSYSDSDVLSSLKAFMYDIYNRMQNTAPTDWRTSYCVSEFVGPDSLTQPTFQPGSNPPNPDGNFNPWLDPGTSKLLPSYGQVVTSPRIRIYQGGFYYGGQRMPDVVIIARLATVTLPGQPSQYMWVIRAAK